LRLNARARMRCAARCARRSRRSRSAKGS
jgi:hypothetical protein